MMLYSLAASSTFTTMAVTPIKVQRASLEVVQKAFAIFMFMRHYSLLYILLHPFSSVSINNGTLYNNSGKIAALSMVYKALCLSPNTV
jgi:hypothetical protein